MKFFKNLSFLSMISGSPTSSSPRAQARPNIVMFYIDDWAWNGSPVAMHDTMKNSLMPVLQMPNIQKLAAEGMKFGNAYGSPQCAPARVCVQTGQSAPHSIFRWLQTCPIENSTKTRSPFPRRSSHWVMSAPTLANGT